MELKKKTKNEKKIQEDQNLDLESVFAQTLDSS